MLKELMQLWSRSDLLKQAYDEANEMLHLVREIFENVVENLLTGKELGYDVHKRDKEVNKMEREVRRKVLEHLSINPKQDVVAGLVLTSVVIDIERIGDYSKNIQELVEMYQRQFSDVQYMLELRDLTRRIQDVFALVCDSFRDGDAEKATVAMQAHKKTKEGCDRIIEQMFKNPDNDTSQAIVAVLYARYLKRVNAHLKNIATSVVNPFDMIGYTRKRGAFEPSQ